MIFTLKQKIRSWLDSYNILDSNGEVLYSGNSRFAWGHYFEIRDKNRGCIATVKQKIWSFLSKFEIYYGSEFVGCVSRQWSFFRPEYDIDFMGWGVEGEFDVLRWNYRVYDQNNNTVARVKREYRFVDTYSVEVDKEENALPALILALSIDAEECSRNS